MAMGRVLLVFGVSGAGFGVMGRDPTALLLV